MRKFLIGTAILGGVGLFAYSIYRYFKIQADLLSKFTYQIVDFGIQQFDLQIIKGQLSVLFKSDADLEVQIDSFYVDFYLNGVKIGYIEDIRKFVIPAHGQSIIPFSYTLNPQILLANIVGIISQTIQIEDEVFEVKGFARVKSGFIAVTLPIEYRTTLKEILNS
jgi:LEA14-like dessication related protein